MNSSFRLDSSAISSLFLVLSLSFFSCETTPSSGTQTVDSLSSAPIEEEAPSHLRTRGMAPTETNEGDFSFARNFPTLSKILAEETDLYALLDSFARLVLFTDHIQSEQDLMTLITLRDKDLIPRVEAAIQTADQNNTLYDDYESLDNELLVLGMQMTFAEGTFTSLGPAPFLTEETERYASKAYRLYAQFEEARTMSYNGEYPFLNMDPYQAMIETGEELMALDKNPYQELIREPFENALIYFHDIHHVFDPTARSEPSTYVNGISTATYPDVTDNRTRQAFASQTSGSALSKALQRILDHPSSMSLKPEHLYLIVVEWENSEQLAKSRVISHLRAGEDIPHHLMVTLADGSNRYAVVYRFFEDDVRAEEALISIQKEFPKAEMMMVSVRGDALFQIGG